MDCNLPFFLLFRSGRLRVADRRLLTNRARSLLDTPGWRDAPQGGAPLVTCGPPLGEAGASSRSSGEDAMFCVARRAAPH